MLSREFAYENPQSGVFIGILTVFVLAGFIALESLEIVSVWHYVALGAVLTIGVIIGYWKYPKDFHSPIEVTEPGPGKSG